MSVEEYVAKLTEALAAKDALTAAEAQLSDAKNTLQGDDLRAAKDALRAQRQAYRINHRQLVMAYEAAVEGGATVSPPAVEATASG